MYFSSIINHFGLQSFSINNGRGAMRTEFSISGKGRKGNVVIFMLFAVTFLIIYLALCKNLKSILITVLIFLITLLVLFVRHKLLFRKLEKSVKNYNIYQREKPSNLRPAHVRMLLKDGLVDELSIVATIADLIDRKYLKISGEFGKFFSSNDTLTIEKTGKSQDDLLLYEKYLIEWFIDICGTGHSVSNENLKSLLSEKVTISSNNRFDDFKGLVLASFPIDCFYSKLDNNKKKICCLILLLLGFFVEMITPFLLFLPILGLGTLLFNCPSYVLNKKGQNEISNWKSLKKFLVDFSNIKDKNSQMIELWDFYLTYSIVLGVNKNAKEEIYSFFGNSINTGSSDELKGYSNDNSESYRNISTSSDGNVEKYDASPLLLGLLKKPIDVVIGEEQVKYGFRQFL